MKVNRVNLALVRHLGVPEYKFYSDSRSSDESAHFTGYGILAFKRLLVGDRGSCCFFPFI